MSAYVYPALFALFVWWLTTGVIIYLDGLQKRTFRWSMLVATAVLAVALFGLSATRDDMSISGAYLAFTCGLLVWGWHEMSFLMGYVTGPNRYPCPANCTGWRRFTRAVMSVIYHELAILATVLVIVLLTWGGENQVGTWTFIILWIMRLSTKLNVFLGVPNITEQFLPDDLHHLKSYFTKKPMNFFFPISITASTVAAAFMVEQVMVSSSAAAEAAGLTFLTTLLILAILEHWFLVLPLPVEALWRWGLRSHARRRSLIRTAEFDAVRNAAIAESDPTRMATVEGFRARTDRRDTASHIRLVKPAGGSYGL